MHGATAELGTAGRFSGVRTPPATADVEPEWRPWLRLFEVATAAVDEPEWERAAASISAPASQPPVQGAPLLAGRTLRVETRRVRQLVRELLRTARRSEEEAARTLAKLRSRHLDVLQLLQAAIAQDVDSIERIASAEEGVDAAALSVIAQLAAIPLLHACAKQLRAHIPESWLNGYCPICGAWPVLAEVRGLERNRRLRCGRCACDWPLPVLQCPYCNELRHDQLGTLLPEGQEQTRRVDTCETCKGYLKSCSTLSPMPLKTLATTDLATIELDLVAHDRGYARPSRPAWAVPVTLEGTARRNVATAPLESRGSMAARDRGIEQ
jgi:FdhE protein